MLNHVIWFVRAGMDMTMTDSPHRSWYDSAAGGSGRDEGDSQLSVAEHMSSLFAHHHPLEPPATRDYPGYRAATVTMTSRYYHGQLHQHASSYAAQHGQYNFPPIFGTFQLK